MLYYFSKFLPYNFSNSSIGYAPSLITFIVGDVQSNIVDGIFEQQSKTVAGHIKQQEDLKIIGEKMLELLKDYDFRVDEKNQKDFTATMDRGIFRYVKLDTSTTGAW